MEEAPLTDGPVAAVDKNAANAASLEPGASGKEAEDLYDVGEPKRWRCVNCDLVFTSPALLGLHQHDLSDNRCLRVVHGTDDDTERAAANHKQSFCKGSGYDDIETLREMVRPRGTQPQQSCADNRGQAAVLTILARWQKAALTDARTGPQMTSSIFDQAVGLGQDSRVSRELEARFKKAPPPTPTLKAHHEAEAVFGYRKSSRCLLYTTTSRQRGRWRE